MVSHAFTLEDYGAAIEMFRAGTGRKLQIRPQANSSVELLGPMDPSTESPRLP